MQMLFYDLRFALRQLRKTPGLALLAILTLALGVGANTAIFTVIENVLLRPLPYANADRLIFIGPGSDKPSFGSTSWLNYRDIRAQSKLLTDAAGYSEDVSVLESRDGSQSVVAPRVTPNLFSMLGARPLLGRTFSEAEGQPGGPAAVLLSESLWRQSFHADPNIVGQTVKIGGTAHTVVGVMRGSFHFPEEMGPDLQKGVWLPLQPTGEMLKDRGYHFFNVVGDLREGVSVRQAQLELDAIAAHIPRTKDDNATTFRATAYQEVLTGPVRPVLYALFGALALVLLIACANVSNLLIARCLGRQQEFAVRAALGAGRLRLVQQMLSEGMALSLLGCGVGVAFAQLAMLAIRKLPDGTIPRADSIAIHWTVVLVLAGIAILTTVLSSLLPALLVARANPQAALQTASRGIGSRSVSGKLSGGLGCRRGRAFHAAAGRHRPAVSHPLESRTGAAWLYDRARNHLHRNARGCGWFFRHDGFRGHGECAGFSGGRLSISPCSTACARCPGVESAALVTSPPLSGMGINSSFDILGQPKDPANKPDASVSAVSGDYARTLGTPIVRGRMIGDGDVASAPPVVVINESLARKYFAGKDPIGKQIDLGGKDTGMIKPLTIVGILGDQVDHIGGDVRPLILSAAATDSHHVPVLSGAFENGRQLCRQDTRQHSGGGGDAFRLSPGRSRICAR